MRREGGRVEGGWREESREEWGGRRGKRVEREKVGGREGEHVREKKKVG